MTAKKSKSAAPKPGAARPGSDARDGQALCDRLPETRERLAHVLRITAEAAATTLAAAEEAATISRSLEAEACRLARLPHDEVKDNAVEIKAFLIATVQGLSQLNGRLTDAVLAQQYQDLSGQVLQRVLAHVAELEEHLLGTVTERPTAAPEGPALRPSGPAATARERAQSVADQQEVDSLLADLGL